jgi:hypothetical protein
MSLGGIMYRGYIEMIADERFMQEHHICSLLFVATLPVPVRNVLAMSLLLAIQ